jgi:DnaK suppressor protein
MPSKKVNKAAKKPGKAIPKKAVHKEAVAKKTARPAPAPKPTLPKVPVKPHKPKSAAPKPAVPKPAVVKTAAAPTNHVAHPARAKAPVVPAAHAEQPPASEKSPPIKFDSRPLVLPTRSAPSDEEDGDGPANLLAGPRNVKPYIARRGEQYMSKEQLEHFARILQSWKRDLMVEVDRTVLHMKDEAANFPDPNDRATQEEEFSLELRTRDRERKLIRKIDEALKRIEDGSYGYCLETGEEIGIKRLEARPVATLSVEAQERRERREKQYGDRDDRYR